MRAYSIILTKFLILIFIINSTACTLNQTSPPTAPEGMPDVGIPVEVLNQKMGVIAPKGWNTFKFNDSIGLVVTAISSEMISFDPTDTKTFLFDNGKWIEIQNDLIYLNQPNFFYILDPAQKNDLTHVGSTGVLPKLANFNEPAYIRIFAFGYIYESGTKTDKKVASYVDVILTP